MADFYVFTASNVVCVCLYVNHGRGTNCNRSAQRLVILRGQTNSALVTCEFQRLIAAH